MRLNSHPSGRHFLQIPGPSNTPDRILRAMDYPTIDHRGPEFNALAKKVLRSIRQVFQTKHPVIVYPASGTGAWEAALVNTLNSGDTVLMWETGHFASLWKKMADRLGIKSEFMGGDWRKPADPAAIEKIPAEKIFFLQLADAPKLSMDVLSWSRHHRLFPGEGAPIFWHLGQVQAPGLFECVQPATSACHRSKRS